MPQDVVTARGLEFLILGPLEVRSDGRPLPLPRAKQRALLTILLLHANEVVSTDRLIDDLWHERPPDTAPNLLQVYVSQLRKILDADGGSEERRMLVTRPPGYVLRADPAQLDSVRFERLVNEGLAALAANDPVLAVSTFDRALALWRGPALSDLAVEDFARSESARLEELRLVAIEERIDALLALGRHAAVTADLEALVADHPDRERLAAQLMLALYRSRRQAHALETFSRTRKRLVEELGIEPSPELQRLERAILNQDPSLDLPERRLPGGAAPAQAGPDAATRSQPAETKQTVRKTVTVLFADFVLTPTRGETIEPETLEPVFSHLGERLTDVVERHGGTINWSSEIEIFAVFGIPRVHEDDALRAVRTAVELRDAIGPLSVRLEDDFGTRVAVRIGINTGLVVAGAAVASASMGGASGVAARLGRGASIGEILIADGTKELVRDAITFEPAEQVGDRPVAWRLLGVLAGVPGVERRLSSPTVGRVEELDALRRNAESVIRDRCAAVVTVVGPAGIGKSHLAHAFARTVAAECRVLQARCPAYGEGSTFAPLADIVRQVGGEQPLDGVRECLADDDDRDVITERIAAAIGLSDSGGQTETTFWAVRKLLEALARERPLLLVLDDLQWAEPTFLDLIEYVVDWTFDAPVFLLCLARADLLDLRPSLAGGKRNMSSMLLKPLGDGEAETLIDNLLGDTALDTERRERIREAAGGNPFFIEQMLAMQTIEPAAAATMPPTIQVLLTARLDQLEAEQHAVLERGSVMGKEFWRDALAEITPAETLDSLGIRLSELVRKQLVEPCRPTIPVGDALRFHSGLIRDAVYESVPKRSRSALHERVGEWLVRRVGGQVGQYEEVVGYHFEQAFRYRKELGPLDDHDRAVGRSGAEYLASAGRRAFGRGDMTLAAALLGRTAELLPADDPLRLDLLPTIGEALHETGGFDSARSVLDEAIAAAEARADRVLEARARLIRALVDASSAGGPDDAVVREAEQATAVFDEARDSAGLATAFRTLAWAHGTAGRYGEAAAAAQRATEQADLAGDERQRGRAATLYALAALHGPTPVPEAAARCRALVDEVAGDRRAEGLATVILGWLEAMRGEFDTARKFAERGRAILVDLGTRVLAASTISSEIERLAGRPDAAERDLRRDFDALTKLGETYLRSTVAGLLAHAVCAQGRHDEALELSRIAEQLAADDDVTSQAFWRSARAKVLARTADLDEAVSLAEQAVELLRGTDALVTLARALVDLAEVLELAGGSERARHALEEAIVLLERKENVVGAQQAKLRLQGLPGATVTADA